MSYILPPPIPRPFNRGDLVLVMNGDHTVCSGGHKVVYVGKKVVRIEDGRRYRASDGWWIGSNGIWPYPWIKLALNDEYTESVTPLPGDK